MVIEESSNIVKCLVSKGADIHTDNDMEEKYVTKFENGNVRIEIYSKDGKTHREDGPAYIRYYENGNKNYEMWMRFGEYYREDGQRL